MPKTLTTTFVWSFVIPDVRREQAHEEKGEESEVHLQVVLCSFFMTYIFSTVFASSLSFTVYVLYNTILCYCSRLLSHSEFTFRILCTHIYQNFICWTYWILFQLPTFNS
jgi:hypothetical protein